MRAFLELVTADAWQLTFDPGTEQNVQVVVPRTAGEGALVALHEVAIALDDAGVWVSLLGVPVGVRDEVLVHA